MKIRVTSLVFFGWLSLNFCIEGIVRYQPNPRTDSPKLLL